MGWIPTSPPAGYPKAVADPTPKRRPSLQALPAVLLPVVLGLALGVIGEGSALTAMTLWLEPLLLALGLYAILALTLHRRYRLAFGATLGLILMVLGARMRPALNPAAGTPPGWASELRACAQAIEPAQGGLRLLSWTLDPGERADVTTLPLAAAKPDLVVVTGTADPELAAALGAALGGEVMPLDAPDPAARMLLAVRGAFQRCGEVEDHWVQDLDGEPDGGRLVATFPEISGVGVVPLITARLGGPGAPGDWAGWPDRVEGAGATLAGLARSLGSSGLILAGDLHVPRTFSHLKATLRGAGLIDLETPPTWPARLGPLPMLPLHTLDQVWAGGRWRESWSGALAARGHDRAPMVVDLAPSTGMAAR